MIWMNTMTTITVTLAEVPEDVIAFKRLAVFAEDNCDGTLKVIVC